MIFNHGVSVDPVERLMSRLADSADVYVAADVDEGLYLKGLSDDIIKNRCEPFLLRAVVKEPGFPDLKEGEVIEGWCVARRSGYWLVYRPEDDSFYCFWGCDCSDLGAHGVYGAPLYCWSA